MFFLLHHYTDVIASQQAEQKNKAEEKPSYRTPGMYKVGTDIPAGEYTVIAKGQCYWSIAKNSTGTLESIIANDVFIGRSIVTLQNGQYFTFEGQNAKMYPTNKVPQVAKNKYNVLLPGMYKVGVDFPPGEYKVITGKDQQGYYAVTTNSTHTLQSVITNNVFTGSHYLTVENGQYLQLTNAILQLK